MGASEGSTDRSSEFKVSIFDRMWEVAGVTRDDSELASSYLGWKAQAL